MALRLHNTLTREVEELRPINAGRVGMYHCGPTVYDYAHVGNLRSYIFADLLRRAVEAEGLGVTQVINITDIGHLTSDADTGDDKMVKGLKRENLPLSLDGLKELANKYEAAFKDDLKALNIKTPHHFPRATEYLEDQIALIEILEEKGFAYKLEDGVYFDTSKLSDYGKLGGLTPLGESVARVGNESKRNPRDFVLWKISRDTHLGFESSWGTGFPGWHIECSAMAKKLLGQPFDIHTGGVDHIPVHHNNEIAQSEAAYGSELARYWLHNEFVTLSDAKMAKSEGSYIRLKDVVERGFSPLAYRYFLLMAHYRSKVVFSWEALEAANNAFEKLKRFVGPIGDVGVVDQAYKAKFMEKIENDLNTPQALAILWTLVKDKEVTLENKLATILEFDKVLGLNLK